MARCLSVYRFLPLSLVLLGTACLPERFDSAPEFDPPKTSYDPSNGQDEGGGGYYDGGDEEDDGADDEDSPCEGADCEPDNIGTFDWRDAIIYFAFVDRFYNGDPNNDGAIGVPLATDWQGGDWAGITQKIEEGYFTDLGINTLWLSVPMDNTDADGIGTDGYDYSAYHGYWPTDLNSPEEHFGTLAELQNLVDTAHAHDLKVIFDYAMNHVHVASPVYTEHPEWFWPNDNGSGGNCICGDGCSWDGDEGRRCWFTPYLPDFDFTIADARAFSVDNAIDWIRRTGADGYRLDAVKHIEDSWIVQLRERVRAEIEPETGEHFYMVGETFTGDRDTIAYYVDPDMLDGQFDFPLRMQLVSNVLMRQGSMHDLASFLESNDTFYGAAIMSTFIGNHDIPRVIHLAEDTPLWSDAWAGGKERAWADRPSLPAGTRAFERMALGFTMLYTMKGAPLVYYGDEIAMPGAGDPDNRRFMQWDDYAAGQTMLREHLGRLAAVRNAHVALRRGARSTLSVTDDTLVYEMRHADEVVYVAINRSDAEAEAAGLPEQPLTDELTDAVLEGPNVRVPPRSALVLVP